MINTLHKTLKFEVIVKLNNTLNFKLQAKESVLLNNVQVKQQNNNKNKFLRIIENCFVYQTKVQYYVFYQLIYLVF